MPTVLRVGPYRFFFYSSDQGEPKHVHVERDHCVAKFWLEPLRMNRSGGFSRAEIRQIWAILEEHRTHLTEAWNDFFGD